MCGGRANRETFGDYRLRQTETFFCNREAVSALPRAAPCTNIRGLATFGLSTTISLFHRFEGKLAAQW